MKDEFSIKRIIIVQSRIQRREKACISKVIEPGSDLFIICRQLDFVLFNLRQRIGGKAELAFVAGACSGVLGARGGKSDPGAGEDERANGSAG